jgi:hypothetical protein
VDIITIRPDLMKEIEVIQIKQNMKNSQDRQKSYANKKRNPEEFKT